MNILIVGDREPSAPNLRLMLETIGHDVTTAADGEEALSVLRVGRFPVIFVDRAMPDMDGIEFCRRIRGWSDASYPYILLLDHDAPPEDRIAGIRAGADDVLAVPPDAGELAVRLEVAGRVLDVLGRMGRRIDVLTELAGTDELTGVRNLRKFRESLDDLFSLSRREGLPLSLVTLDVDGFKAYNDSVGHPEGDEVLRRVAALIGVGVRKHDVVARVGGDEFAILLLGAGAEEAVGLAERLRSTLDTHQWPCRPITASLGVATASPATDRPDTLIDEADRALYASKRQGRDRVTHFDDLTAWRP